MTDVCRFDFNSVPVAVFQRGSAVPLMHNGNWIADRRLDKSFAKPRRQKFFLDAAECGRRQTERKTFK
jgi:hypothetical protein